MLLGHSLKGAANGIGKETAKRFASYGSVSGHDCLMSQNFMFTSGPKSLLVTKTLKAGRKLLKKS